MTDIDIKPPQHTPPPEPNVAIRRVWWPLRNLWRSLTSMRTALALLFLLALGAVPGALLPQRDLNAGKTAEYISKHGLPARIMDRLQMFSVFSSVWFTAIYVLLFISLVGCLTPRMIEHAKSLRAVPVPAPRNFARLPRSVEFNDRSGTPEEIADRALGNLRGWRKTMRTGSAGVIEISAEKGYLREFGNLVFHFALLGLLVAIAVGKLYGYEGTRSLIADGSQQLCNTSTASYDSFRGGNLVDGTDLTPFCVEVDKFSAVYLPTGQPDMYSAAVRYQTADQLDSNTWESATIKVNHPLRIEGERVYLLGNGFAPTFTVTFPGGQTRTQTVPFRPDDSATMMSSGAARFDTPAGLYPNEDQRRQHQVALEGLFAPTAQYQGSLLTSSFPLPQNPAVAIDIYVGDTGLDTGRPQNVFELDRDMINQGRLLKKARVNLTQGQSTTLPDSTQVRFDGYQRWVSIQVSHDPAQDWVLVCAIAMLAGLLVSLLIKRRRVWLRITPAMSSDAAQRPTVEVAGLARTDQAGWGDGFAEFAARVVAADPGHAGARETDGTRKRER